jgi:hypothetical protein
MRKKALTVSQKIDGIRREFGQEKFRCSAFPRLGFQTLWVSGDNQHAHRGYELARFPMFAIFVFEEKPR